jgi:mannose/fructose/N-acetylgalactosamine-specific phosphotransferase system component IIB
MVSLLRVDERLVHGQVVQAWLPALRVARVVVADDAACQSPLSAAAMGLALGGEVEFICRPLGQVDFRGLAADRVATLVLVRDVAAAVAAHAAGLRAKVNLGNVHAAPGRRAVSASLHLSDAELSQLQRLADAGVEVEARAVPAERPLGLQQLRQQLA